MIPEVFIQPNGFEVFILGIRPDHLLEHHSDCTALIGGNTDPLVDISVLDPIEAALLQNVTPLFIKRNLISDLIQFSPAQVGKIQLVSQHPEHSDIEPGHQRRLPQGLVVRAGGYVGSHTAHRIAVAVTLLNMHPANRVRIVAGPDLRAVTQDSQIKPVSSGGASLEQDLREPLRQRPHQAVEAHHIPVCGLPLSFRRQITGIDVGEDPVHIPFHIGDLRR